MNCIKINHCFISLKKIELLHRRHRGLPIMRNFIYREPTKHLWIGYAKNETTDLMAENGTCVVGPSLPVTFTPWNEECVMLDVSATIEANLLYTAVCEETHEYLCETPNIGTLN